MPRDLFGDVVSPSLSAGNKQWYAVPVSMLAHAAALVAVLVAPILATGVLPTPGRTVVYAPAPPPPPRPFPRAAAARLPHLPSPPSATAINVHAAPVQAPARLTPEPVPRGLPVGHMQSVPLAPAAVLLRPPPPRAPVRVGGNIRRPSRTRYVDPVYPAIAKAARVTGVVIVEATIAHDGAVRDARVVRSVPMLDQAALDAVTDWRYSPTLLNGEPVEVVMSVTVTFTID
jgi:protein TonB